LRTGPKQRFLGCPTDGGCGSSQRWVSSPSIRWATCTNLLRRLPHGQGGNRSPGPWRKNSRPKRIHLICASCAPKTSTSSARNVCRTCAPSSLKPWARTNGKGVFINHEASCTSNDCYVCEIAPSKKLEPQHHLYGEMIWPAADPPRYGTMRAPASLSSGRRAQSSQSRSIASSGISMARTRSRRVS
jgi:hypothetical protein